MPAAYPKELRDDVVAVARKGDMPITQVAKDFGITESCLRRWLSQDDVEAGNRPGVTRAGNEELKQARRRARELEMENEVLRRAAAYLTRRTWNWAKVHNELSHRDGPGPRSDIGDSVVPGPGVLPSGSLPVTCQTCLGA